MGLYVAYKLSMSMFCRPRRRRCFWSEIYM